MATDGEDHRRASDGILDHRLTQLEKRVDAGFAHIDARLDNLAYVRGDVYHAEKGAIEQRVHVIEKKLAPGGEIINEIAESRRPGVWALSVIGAAFLVALVGFLVQIAVSGPT